MNPLLRVMVALLLGLLAAVAAIGSDEIGGGDGGVWILPRSSSLATGRLDVPLSAARASRGLGDFSKPVDLKLPSEMGRALATLTVRGTGNTVALPSDGGIVRLSSSMLQGLAGVAPAIADLLIVDAAGRGLRATLVFESETHATLYVY